MDEAKSAHMRPNWLFECIPMVPLPRLQYWTDGDVGHRVLFIADEGETFVVTFEEGMKCMDQRRAPGCIDAEHHSKNLYLHQCRGTQDNVCFFRLEWTDSGGAVHIQPGQMVTDSGYIWADGIEPVLLSIMTSLQMPYSA